jgi:hypothetical protein
MSNSCVFCESGGAGILSNEHVIPRWLLEHLDIPKEDLLFQGVASSQTDDLIQSPRIHSTFNFVQGHVCRRCNNGWMSRLEAVAKPLLVPLIDGQTRIEDLVATQSTIIGKWAAKTAYMHSFTSPLKQPVSADHIKALNGDVGQLFSSVGVFGMQADYKQQSGYFLTRYWPYLSNHTVGIPAEVAQSSYKIGLQFRHLNLLVAFWPNPRSVFILARGLHTPVFPQPKYPQPKYSANFTVGDGPVDQLAVFCRSLALWID